MDKSLIRIFCLPAINCSMHNLSFPFLDSVFFSCTLSFSLTVCTVLYRHCRADVSHWKKSFWPTSCRCFFLQSRNLPNSRSKPEERAFHRSPASHHAASPEKEPAACSSPSPQSAFGKCFQWAGRTRESPEPVAMQGGVNDSPADIPSFSPLPPISAVLLGPYSLSPALPSLALYTYTLPCTSSSLLQQPLTKTSPLIPSLFKIGRPRELVDKVHTSREFLFYSLDASVMKTSPSILCLPGIWSSPSTRLPPCPTYWIYSSLSNQPHGVPHCCCLLKVLLHVYGMWFYWKNSLAKTFKRNYSPSVDFPWHLQSSDFLGVLVSSVWT